MKDLETEIVDLERNFGNQPQEIKDILKSFIQKNGLSRPAGCEGSGSFSEVPS